MYLAFDFGGTFVKAALIENGTVVQKWKDKAPLESKEQFHDYIAGWYQAYPDTVQGIAISMPGIIDPVTGYAYRAGSYKKLADSNIYELLSDIPCKVAVENDGKAATLAELVSGKLKGAETGAVITIGTGLGGGIVTNGKLLRGSHFAAGEITGFLLEPGNYSMEGCAALSGGMTGFLLHVAKAKGMDASEFEVSDNFVENPRQRSKKYGGKEVLQWVTENDPVTSEVYHKWIEKLIMIILNLQITLDTEKILIGGGISANEMFLSDLKAEYKKAGESLSIYRRFGAEIDSCQYREDANLLGAVYNYQNLYE